MSESWFPGHMLKARRAMQENLKLVDVVLEVRDARAPRSTTNPDFGRLLGLKPRVVALNKLDLADPGTTRQWVEHLQNGETAAVPVNALAGQGVSEIVRSLRAAAEEMQQKRTAKGMRERAVRTMVVGIPNVGKSQLINRLVGKAAARTGDKPGVTRGKQWVRFAEGFELLDTPGILWPKLADPVVKGKLAMLGAIGESDYDAGEVALAFLAYAAAVAPAGLRGRYNLEQLAAEPLANLAAIGRKRGCLRAGGEIDLYRAAAIVLRDYQTGALGRISLELPGDEPDETEAALAALEPAE